MLHDKLITILTRLPPQSQERERDDEIYINNMLQYAVI